MKPMKHAAAFVALAAALVALGCLGSVRQPEITLTGVRVSGLGLRGGSLLAELEIMNPNRFAVETRSITYDLKVADPSAQGESWVDFARGEFLQPVRVRDGDTQRVEIPIEFTYSALGSALRSIMDRGAFDYRVEGVVALREPLRRSVPFRHRGNISLQGVR